MRVSEAINFNRRLRTPFIKPSNISARNPLSQLSNSKHFIKLRAAANLRELRWNSAGNWLLNYAPLSLPVPQKVFVLRIVQVSCLCRCEIAAIASCVQSLASSDSLTVPACSWLLWQSVRCSECYTSQRCWWSLTPGPGTLDSLGAERSPKSEVYI